MTKAISIPVAGIVVVALAAVLFALLAFTGTVSAHQATSFDPADKNCMGKLTSFHAKDDKGIKNSAANWPHRGIANELGMDPADGSVQSFQQLSQAWCQSE